MVAITVQLPCRAPLWELGLSKMQGGPLTGVKPISFSFFLFFSSSSGHKMSVNVLGVHRHPEEEEEEGGAERERTLSETELQ